MSNNLRRPQAAEYIRTQHGIPCTTKTFANYASKGGGPLMRFWGRILLYDTAEVDGWVSANLSKPIERTVGRRELTE